MTNEKKLYVLKPFGPGIGEAIIPKSLIDKINKFVDRVVDDKEKSKELDWGKNLVGQVSQEIYLPKEIIEGELINFLSTITKTYVEGLTNKNITKFNLIKVWVVRQFENEYNPVHWHGGHISGAGCLKLPNYLMHSVNPFYGKGERRSMSFNAMVDEEIYDVHANE